MAGKQSLGACHHAGYFNKPLIECQVRSISLIFAAHKFGNERSVCRQLPFGTSHVRTCTNTYVHTHTNNPLIFANVHAHTCVLTPGSCLLLTRSNNYTHVHARTHRSVTQQQESRSPGRLPAPTHLRCCTPCAMPPHLC